MALNNTMETLITMFDKEKYAEYLKNNISLLQVPEQRLFARLEEVELTPLLLVGLISTSAQLT